MYKVIFPFLMFMSFVCISCAQTETTNHKSLSNRFKNFYNENKFDSIYSMFSDEAKVGFPLDKTKIFMSQLKDKYKNIKAMTLVEDQPELKVYKGLFDQGVLSIRLSIDKNEAITGLYFRPYEEDTSAVIKRNLTLMNLPFKGEWTVFWGGDTKELNYHVVARFQKNAFDIVRNGPDGKSYRTNGKTNEDYYAFGQEIIAPCDGEVVTVIDGIKDNVPGKMNALYAPGNSILLKTRNNEFILLAHIKQHTTAVKQGQQVSKGQLLGLCGNSGNSSEPHLHFHLQNIEDLSLATGIKCYFDKMDVNGVMKLDYSPIKGDRIKATEK